MHKKNEKNEKKKLRDHIGPIKQGHYASFIKKSNETIVLFCRAIFFFSLKSLASIDLGHFFVFYNIKWSPITKFHPASLETLYLI